MIGITTLFWEIFHINLTLREVMNLGIAQTLSKAIKFLQNGNDQKAIEFFEQIIY